MEWNSPCACAPRLRWDNPHPHDVDRYLHSPDTCATAERLEIPTGLLTGSLVVDLPHGTGPVGIAQKRLDLGAEMLRQEDRLGE